MSPLSEDSDGREERLLCLLEEYVALRPNEAWEILPSPTTMVLPDLEYSDKLNMGRPCQQRILARSPKTFSLLSIPVAAEYRADLQENSFQVHQQRDLMSYHNSCASIDSMHASYRPEKKLPLTARTARTFGMEINRLLPGFFENIPSDTGENDQ